MGTGNFHYENRCIVVQDKDYECGNVPKREDYYPKSLRSYPAYLLDNYDYKFWDVVITSGYYEAGCIDYRQRDDAMYASHWFNLVRYSTVREFCEDVYNEFKGLMSMNKIRKMFAGYSTSMEEIYDFLDKRFEKFAEFLAEEEKKQVNVALDKLKEEYGYNEYAVTVRFSNGETWYQKVS